MNIPDQPKNSYRVTINTNSKISRLDIVLMEAIREQSENLTLKHTSRTIFKDMFAKKRILIKGQPAKPSSGLARGTTYIDILL